jgi:uncharacterized BrkB/YihY/UPF0761 family membrane protein
LVGRLVLSLDIQAKALTGSCLALVVGIVTTLWAGLGVTQAGLNAMNEIWDVPLMGRPGRTFPIALWRAPAARLVLVAGSIPAGGTYLT